MASDNSSGIHVAVLDDYSATSVAHLSPLIEKYKSRGLTIDYLPDTIATSSGPGMAPQVHRLQRYTVISTMRERTKFPGEMIAQLPNLKLLLTTAARNASIDVAACEKAGIVVAGTGTPAFGGAGAVKRGDTTNEQTWALLLALMRGVPADDVRVKTNAHGGWQDGLASGLAGRTIGILGLGRLGAQCALTAYAGFGMEVVCWSSSLTQEKADEVAAARGLAKGTFKVAKSKEEFFRAADVVSVHYVLSERSRGIVGETELGWMKKTAFLVNTSRGPLVDEAALLRALREKTIRGAALDVFDVEPLPIDSPWRTEEFGRRLVLSPHMGYVEEHTINAWYQQTAENLERWLNGEQVLNVMKSQ